MSVVRTCDGKIIKVTHCIIKVSMTRGNITWRSFALRDWAYNQKAHGNLCFPLRRPIFYFYAFTFMQESKYSSLFLFIFSFCKHHVVRKHLGTYMQLDMSGNELLLLTSPWGEYVGRQNYKPLSFYVSGWNFLLMCMQWVLAII